MIIEFLLTVSGAERASRRLRDASPLIIVYSWIISFTVLHFYNERAVFMSHALCQLELMNNQIKDNIDQ